MQANAKKVEFDVSSRMNFYNQRNTCGVKRGKIMLLVFFYYVLMSFFIQLGTYDCPD